MLKKWEEIKQAISDFFDDLKEWAFDVVAVVFESILGAIASVVESLPMPDFVLNYTINDYLHPDITYFLGMSSVGSALALIGAAYGFRILRRFLTLGIW